MAGGSMICKTFSITYSMRHFRESAQSLLFGICLHCSLLYGLRFFRFLKIQGTFAVRGYVIVCFGVDLLDTGLICRIFECGKKEGWIYSFRYSISSMSNC